MAACIVRVEVGAVATGKRRATATYKGGVVLWPSFVLELMSVFLLPFFSPSFSISLSSLSRLFPLGLVAHVITGFLCFVCWGN